MVNPVFQGGDFGQEAESEMSEGNPPAPAADQGENAEEGASLKDWKPTRSPGGDGSSGTSAEQGTRVTEGKRARSPSEGSSPSKTPSLGAGSSPKRGGPPRKSPDADAAESRSPPYT